MELTHIFTGVDMRQGHDGLRQVAKGKVNLLNMPDGSAVAFISNDRKRMKVYTFNHVLSYIRREDIKRPIDLQALQEFPRAFDSAGRFDYNKALKLRLMKALKIKDEADSTN